MNEYALGQYDRGIYSDPDPSQSDFPSVPRKITRCTTKTKAHGDPGLRSKDERRIRRTKRAQRSLNRR